MTVTAESFYRLNMRSIHDLVGRHGRWCRNVALVRVGPAGYRERDGILLWGGGPDSGGRNPIYYAWTRYGSVAPMAGTIWTTSIPCRLGGRRWYFVCPETGRRCQRLYLRGDEWVCRQAAGFDLYESQLTFRGLARPIQQAETVLARLGVPDIYRYHLASRHKFPDRPRYMRWRRYQRLCDDLYERYQERLTIGLIMVTALAAHAGQQQIYRECLAEARRREIEWEAEREADRETGKDLHSQ